MSIESEIGTDLQRSRKRFPLWLQLLALFLVTIGVVTVFVAIGNQGVQRCAVDYPHDGQCGLVAVMDDIYGFGLAGLILLVGVIVILRRWTRAAGGQER
jgi:drug/metabolite transporter (DMT)-like permease